MKFEFRVQDLTFRGVQRDIPRIDSIINEIRLVSLNGENCSLHFHFDKNIPAYPTGMLLFLEFYRDIIKSLPFLKILLDVDPTSYLYSIGFLSASNGFVTENLNRNIGKTNIPITQIKREKINELCESRGITVGEATEILITPFAKLISDYHENLIEPFTFVIREIARNSFEHSNTKNILLCIQHWPRRDQIEIAIADTGDGVFSSLSSNMNYRGIIENNEDALRLALEPGVSRNFSKLKKEYSSPWDNSGHGLFYAHQLCIGLSGYFTFGSYDARLTVSTDGNITGNDFNYNGTLVGMIFKPSRLQDYRNLMQEISIKARERVKEFDYGFKSPSESSKG